MYHISITIYRKLYISNYYFSKKSNTKGYGSHIRHQQSFSRRTQKHQPCASLTYFMLEGCILLTNLGNRIEVEQLFTVLQQWRTAVPKVDWAPSRSNHTKCYPSMWIIFVMKISLNAIVKVVLIVSDIFSNDDDGQRILGYFMNIDNCISILMAHYLCKSRFYL